MTKFIAEICSNHNGSLKRAISLIEAAAEIGCWGVKFQLFRIDKMFAPEIVNHPAYSYVSARRDWELPVEWLPELAKVANNNGLKFGCTPFYLDAVDELNPYVNFFKIASYEMGWLDLLKTVVKTNKPVMMSTGLNTMDEIIKSVSFVNNHLSRRQSFALLHCVSSYPTLVENANLAIMTRFQHLWNWADVGYSDHTVLPSVIYRAAHKYEAEIIEFHLDLDGKGWEYNILHCWLPDAIKSVIATVNDGFVADGNGDLGFVERMKDRDFRRDPDDGLRPMKEKRGRL